MIVYGSSLAPAVRKVLAFIGEKGLHAEHRPVAPHDQSPAFKATSPFGAIPGFSDGDYRLCDSAAICHYLERKHPHPALLPAGAAEYGRAVWFDQFADGPLGAAECKVVLNLVVRKLRNEAPDRSAVETALKDELPPLFDYLEGQVVGPFLVGGALTLADLAVASPFASLKTAGHPVDNRRWPKLAAYTAGIHARPAFARVKD